MRAGPVWRRSSLRHRHPPPEQVDVLIIGGGISGVGALHWLGNRGLRVALVEQGALAAGASGRNAGFLLRGVAENYALAAERYGRRTAADIWAFTAENHDLTVALCAGIDVGYRRAGCWTLAADAQEAQTLQQSATMLGEDGFSVQWIERPAPPLHRHHGGILDLDEGEIDPARAVRAIARAHRDAIHESVEVLAVEPGGTAVRVQHSLGETIAGAVVIAVNGWTRGLLPDVDIRPVRAQMCATAPAPGVRLDRPAYAAWGYRYWRQLDDGRVLCGGFRDRALDDEVGLDIAPTASIQRHLDTQLNELGVEARVTRRWAGTMGFSPDGLPLVGPLPSHPGVHLLGGYSGHGMGFAVHCARVLVDHLCDGTPIPDWLHAARG